MKRSRRSKLLWLAAPLVLSLGLLAGTLPMMASATPPSSPPGQGACSHGNSGKECRDDPSPNGSDCDAHGKDGVGGVNEDHCTGSTTTTDETTPVTTTDVTTTDLTTTDVTTTDVTTTDVTTTDVTTTDATTTTDTRTSPSTVPDTPGASGSAPEADAGAVVATQERATTGGVAGAKVIKTRAAQKAKARPKRQVKAALKQPHVNKASIQRVRALPFTL